MRHRRGHGRPVGTRTAFSRFSWPAGDPAPDLGEVTFEVLPPPAERDPNVLERAFLLVGVEETASRERPYRLQFERLDWADALVRVEAGAPWWVWWKTPRSDRA